MKIWHPFTQHKIANNIPIISKAKDSHIYEGQKKIIDAISSWWVITHGHNNERICNAIRAQMEKYDQIIFANISHEIAEKFAFEFDKFLRNIISNMSNHKEMLNNPSEHSSEKLEYNKDHFSHIFFSDSGSTAVEVAIKMAIANFYNKGQSRGKIICLEHAYHGDTIASMSVGNPGVFNNAFEELFFDVIRINFPINDGQNTINQLLFEIEKNRNNIAAIIIEPLIAGAGGMKFSNPNIIREISKICKQNDIFVIYDEIMTGFGRTGSCFAFEQVGFLPDILLLGKGLTGGFLPLSLVTCTQDVYTPYHDLSRAKMFYHSSSFTANSFAVAAAFENIAIWNDENIIAKIQKINSFYDSLFEKLAKFHFVKNKRKMGVIAAFEILDDGNDYLNNISVILYEYFLSHNILLRPLGNTIYILPPYCLLEDEYNLIEKNIINALKFVEEKYV